jgi:hypothetical protein
MSERMGPRHRDERADPTGAERARRYRRRRSEKKIILQLEIPCELLEQVAARFRRTPEHLLADRERLSRALAWLAQQGLAAIKESTT